MTKDDEIDILENMFLRTCSNTRATALKDNLTNTNVCVKSSQNN